MTQLTVHTRCGNGPKRILNTWSDLSLASSFLDETPEPTQMKNFLTSFLALSLVAGVTNFTIADDTTAPAQDPKQQDTTPAQNTKPAQDTNPAQGGARRGGRGDRGGAAAGAKLKIGAEAPSFTLKTTDGKDWSLSDAKGKIVVLQWVNPNCPVCVRVSSDGTVNKTIKGCTDQFADVVYVAINSSASDASSLAATGAYLADHKVAIPALLDSDGAVGKLYGAKTTPHCFVIDSKGILVYQGAIDDNQRGTGKANYVVNAVTQLKAGEPVSPSETKSYGCGVKY